MPSTIFWHVPRTQTPCVVHCIHCLKYSQVATPKPPKPSFSGRTFVPRSAIRIRAYQRQINCHLLTNDILNSAARQHNNNYKIYVQYRKQRQRSQHRVVHSLISRTSEWILCAKNILWCRRRWRSAQLRIERHQARWLSPGVRSMMHNIMSRCLLQTEVMCVV